MILLESNDIPLDSVNNLILFGMEDKINLYDFVTSLGLETRISCFEIHRKRNVYFNLISIS